MDERLKENLKKFLNRKEYVKYNEIMQDEIIKEIVKKVREVDSNYMYDTLPELVTKSEILENKYTIIAEMLYNLSNEETNEINTAERMTDLYDCIINN